MGVVAEGERFMDIDFLTVVQVIAWHVYLFYLRMDDLNVPELQRRRELRKDVKTDRFIKGKRTRCETVWAWAQKGYVRRSRCIDAFAMPVEIDAAAKRFLV